MLLLAAMVTLGPFPLTVFQCHFQQLTLIDPHCILNGAIFFSGEKVVSEQYFNPPHLSLWG